MVLNSDGIAALRWIRRCMRDELATALRDLAVQAPIVNLRTRRHLDGGPRYLPRPRVGPARSCEWA